METVGQIHKPTELFSSGSTAEALEGIYHRLVHLVVGLVTDKMQGEAKAQLLGIS